MTLADNTASQLLSSETQNVFSAYTQLTTDDKLALLYYIYEAMGEAITPAAPTAADPNLAPRLLGDFYNLPQEQQLAIMRQIVNSEATDYSRAYGALGSNNQLLVWYGWAQGMGDTVVDMPADYQSTQSVNPVLDQIKQLEFQEQISLLREIASRMGHTDVQPIPTQAETGKTSSL
ncbi:MAG: orange carotenoid protein [Cyanobacteria bacterium RM1_2_2]|nr:orange carotenoid protein [Cyanobacteria bacterium RM1_2_2]